MKPGLYIVATPIGNLEDISIRAKKILGDVDIIICENPKHSLKLLSKLGIKKKMYSLHDHNEEKLIKRIENNLFERSFALISDAGSPLISDPGFKLVRYFIEKQIKLITIPGPSSIISSIQISGMPCDSFKFFGFAPKSKNLLDKFVHKINIENVTSIFFVSNHRLINCLEVLAKIMGNRPIAICKELTKINENVFRGLPQEVLKDLKLNKKNALGEFVILVKGTDRASKLNNFNQKNSEIDKQIQKLLKKYSLTDVVEIVHKLTEISKKTVYKKALELKK